MFFSPHLDPEVLVSQYIEALKSPEVLTRCGCALALGSLPRFIIRTKLQQVGPPKMTDARKSSLVSGRQVYHSTYSIEIDSSNGFIVYR